MFTAWVATQRPREPVAPRIARRGMAKSFPLVSNRYDAEVHDALAGGRLLGQQCRRDGTRPLEGDDPEPPNGLPVRERNAQAFAQNPISARGSVLRNVIELRRVAVAKGQCDVKRGTAGKP